MISFERLGKEVKASVTSNILVDQRIFPFLFSTDHEYIAELLKDKLNEDFKTFVQNVWKGFEHTLDLWKEKCASKEKRIRQLLKFIRGNKLKGPRIK